MRPPALTSLDDLGPALTPAEAAAIHDQPESAAVAWFAIPAPGGAGVIARAHTEAHDGGRLLPGHLAAAGLAELHAMMPPGLTFDRHPWWDRHRGALVGGGADARSADPSHTADRCGSGARILHYRCNGP
jgi:hypothetical protein